MRVTSLMAAGATSSASQPTRTASTAANLEAALRPLDTELKDAPLVRQITCGDVARDTYLRLAFHPNGVTIPVGETAETLVKDNLVVLAGEISSTGSLDHVALVRDAIRAIGYDDPAQAFHADGVNVLQHLTGGNWGFVIRRPLEAATRNLPLMALLFVPILFGLGHLYEWAHAAEVAADPVLPDSVPCNPDNPPTSAVPKAAPTARESWTEAAAAPSGSWPTGATSIPGSPSRTGVECASG